MVVLAQLAAALKTSPMPGDCGAARASQEAQPHFPKLGRSQEEKQILPGAVHRAEPKEGPTRRGSCWGTVPPGKGPTRGGSCQH